MPRKKKQVEEEQEAGAPEWMVTFSDCMTLLLTFFVLLLSFATFEVKVFENLSQAFGKAVPKITYKLAQNEQVFKVEPVQKQTEEDASVTQTQVQKPTKNHMKETEPKNFRSLRVFTIDSDEVFMGRGKALRGDAKETFDLMAKYLNKMPAQVVISESGTDAGHSGAFYGAQRAHSVADYLVNEGGIDSDSISISGSRMLHKSAAMDGRKLVITLLERTVHEP